MKAKNSLWRWLSVLSFLLTVAVNGYANTAKLNGVTTAEVSDMFNALFVPAGYVFSIWGVIYLFLIAFLIYQFTPAQKKRSQICYYRSIFCAIEPGKWIVAGVVPLPAALFHHPTHVGSAGLSDRDLPETAYRTAEGYSVLLYGLAFQHLFGLGECGYYRQYDPVVGLHRLVWIWSCTGDLAYDHLAGGGCTCLVNEQEIP